jgi:hypothetical protein
MSMTPPTHRFGKNQLWYIATALGFAIGFAVGADVLTPSNNIFDTWLGPNMKLFFWIFPAGGAGVGMGLAQWILIRRIHKNAYLWLLATAVGVVVIFGGALLIFVVTNYYRGGNLSWLFSNVPSWIVPVTVITPIIIFIGPFFQWLIMRYFTKNHSFREFLKMSIGWIISTVVLFTLFGLGGSLVRTRNDILNWLAVMASTIPSGLIFAYSTIDIVRNPMSESRGL